MFSDNLTDNLLRICDTKSLSYETAAERCDISACYFGRIIRKKVSPSLRILERICIGLHLTPNELLGFSSISQSDQLVPTSPSISRLQSSKHALSLPVCPQCNSPICQAFSNFCCNCGQALTWDLYEDTNASKAP